MYFCDVYGIATTFGEVLQIKQVLLEIFWSV